MCMRLMFYQDTKCQNLLPTPVADVLRYVRQLIRWDRGTHLRTMFACGISHENLTFHQHRECRQNLRYTQCGQRLQMRENH